MSGARVVGAHYIQDMRRRGCTLQAIADQLNREAVPSPRGGTWWPSTIKLVAVQVQAGPL